MNSADQYKSFISWQCRLRKLSMRELEGRPTQGMSAGLYSTSGGDEQARLNFLILKQDSESVTASFRHIVRKTQDPTERIKSGLRILAERYYQQNKDFSSKFTALFNMKSPMAEALLEAGKCKLKFSQDSISHEFDFDVKMLIETDEAFQATYWHNHLFNAAIPGKVQILEFNPRL